MSKVEAQANVLDTLIQNNGVVRGPPWLDLLITLLLAYITVLIVWSARPLSGILALIGIGLALSVLSYFVFAIGGLWINLVHPLVAIFISYYFFIPYRLIVENKKSWEYLQKKHASHPGRRTQIELSFDDEPRSQNSHCKNSGHG
jgi:CHASE2 domain-containing sensor protein